MIVTKKTITRSWYKTESPTIEQWLGIVRDIHCMEKMTYQLRLKEDVSITKWKKWVLYDITKDVNCKLYKSDFVEYGYPQP